MKFTKIVIHEGVVYAEFDWNRKCGICDERGREVVHASFLDEGPVCRECRGKAYWNYPDCLRWPLEEIRKQLGRPEASEEECCEWAIAQYLLYSQMEIAKETRAKSQQERINSMEAKIRADSGV